MSSLAEDQNDLKGSLNCVICGKFAVWSGQRSMSSEHVTQWWDKRKAAGAAAGYPDRVLCLNCERNYVETSRILDELIVENKDDILNSGRTNQRRVISQEKKQKCIIS